MKNVLIIGGIVLLGLIFVPVISNSIQSSKLQSEIDRVARNSNISPLSVECGNVELAQVCYAEFASLNNNQAKQMLSASGYALVEGKTEVSATNKSAKIRVDSEPTDTQSSGITLKFKDIEVTL